MNHRECHTHFLHPKSRQVRVVACFQLRSNTKHLAPFDSNLTPHFSRNLGLCSFNSYLNFFPLESQDWKINLKYRTIIISRQMNLNNYNSQKTISCLLKQLENVFFLISENEFNYQYVKSIYEVCKNK